MRLRTRVLVPFIATLFLLIVFTQPLRAQHQHQQQQYIMDGVPVSASTYEAAQLVSQGIALMRANQNAEACQKLQLAVNMAPDYAEAHHNYGLVLARLGNMQAALEQMQLAVSLKPTLDVSWLSLGGLYQASGKINEAIKTYSEYLQRFPASPDSAKIASLVTGLRGIAAQVPSTGSTNKDYLAEVTHDGIATWPATSMPLKVFIKSGVGVPGYESRFLSILKKSFSDWEAAAAHVKFKFVDDAETADIVCNWTSNNQAFANTSELGETHVTTSGTTMVRCSIDFLTVPFLPGSSLSDNNFRSTALHEIGHVLGLTGHTTNPDDIMFYDSATINDAWRNLSVRDINTLNALYSLK